MKPIKSFPIFSRKSRTALLGGLAFIVFSGGAFALTPVSIEIQGSNVFPNNPGGDFAPRPSSGTNLHFATSQKLNDDVTLSLLGSVESGSAIRWHDAWSSGGYVEGAELNARNFHAAANFAASVTGNKFLEFTLVLDEGSSLTGLTLDSFSVSLWRNGPAAAPNYQFAVLENSTWVELGSAFNVSNHGLANSQTLTLPDLSSIFSDVTEVTLRLYGWGAGQDTGNTHFYNVEAVYTPIPEPSTYALLAGLGMLGLVLLRRRFRK